MAHLVETVRISVVALEGKQEELMRTCRLVTQKERLHPACQSSNVYQDVENKHTIVIEQQWDRWQHLMDFFRSTDFLALLGAMRWLGRSYEIRLQGAQCQPKGKSSEAGEKQ